MYVPIGLCMRPMDPVCAPRALLCPIGLLCMPPLKLAHRPISMHASSAHARPRLFFMPLEPLLCSLGFLCAPPQACTSPPHALHPLPPNPCVPWGFLMPLGIFYAAWGSLVRLPSSIRSPLPVHALGLFLCPLALFYALWTLMHNSF
jgi:hypothetical protein